LDPAQVVPHVVLCRMALCSKAGTFPKSPPTAALFKIVNGLVHISSLLAAAAGSDHVFNPKVRIDIPI
jgi:hypothetical protein